MKNEIDLCWSIENDEKIEILGFILEMTKENSKNGFKAIYNGKNQYFHVNDLNPGELYLYILNIFIISILDFVYVLIIMLVEVHTVQFLNLLQKVIFLILLM